MERERESKKKKEREKRRKKRREKERERETFKIYLGHLQFLLSTIKYGLYRKDTFKAELGKFEAKRSNRFSYLFPILSLQLDTRRQGI